MNPTFYATLTLPIDRMFCLAIPARDMMDAMHQLNAFIAGMAACGGIIPTIEAISGNKPRGVEAQAISHYVKLPE